MHPGYTPDLPVDFERPEAPPAAMAREVPETIDWLKALRCLTAVAAHGSTMRAADAIHLSQPAVTRSILDLERHMGQALFDRGPRGMAATPLGARVAARAQRLQELLALGAAEAVQLSAPTPRRSPSPERFAAVAAPASLKALLAVAARASESRAAESLGISQPAVHRSLRALEDACGVALYIKSARGTRLTDSGEALLRRVKLAVAELRAMEADIAAWRGQVRGRVIVGALPLSVHLVLPQAVAAVRDRHPQIEITVVDGTYESLTHQLRSADVDVVVGALRADPLMEVEQESLFHDELVVVARPGHPCLGSGVPTLEQLLQWPWIVPLPATPARVALERVFAEQGLALPRDQLQATSAQFTRTIVAHTDHLALASRGQALEDERVGFLRIVPVVMGSMSREIGIALRGGGESSPDLRALVEALREQAARFCPARPCVVRVSAA
jgi:LysR family transcriptional regulator of gallate degradation